MQEFWCQMIGEHWSSPVESFEFIGGWYSVRALDAILQGAGEAAWVRAARTHARGADRDVPGRSPKAVALEVLQKLIPAGLSGPASRPTSNRSSTRVSDRCQKTRRSPWLAPSSREPRGTQNRPAFPDGSRARQ